MYTNHYYHLKLSEERAKEGLRKAELARHLSAAQTVGEAKYQQRTKPSVGTIVRSLLMRPRTA